jgi:putative colanic acid biosynthesis UDP-glucose lipid carrier transferase
LPQLFNVLSGEMSLVGPRPHMLEHTEEYRDRMDAFMLRHLIQPGLTGMAQVQGNRGSIESQDELSARVSADVYYMENWNLLLDLKIVLLTFFQLFSPSVKAR